MEANKCNTDFLNRLLQLPCVLVKGKLWGLPVFSKCSQEKKTTNKPPKRPRGISDSDRTSATTTTSTGFALSVPRYPAGSQAVVWGYLKATQQASPCKAL